MSRRIYHQQFLQDLQRKSSCYQEGNLEIIDRYDNMHKHILCKDEYDLVKVQPMHLLNNKTPTIKSAINKTRYFKEMLLKKNEHYKNGVFWLKGDYEGDSTKILCEDKYGLLEPFVNNLLKGRQPTIKCAVDQNSYFTAQAREVHGEKYGYELVNYKRSDVLVNIICRIKGHGEFPQVPNSHVINRAGCPKCALAITTQYHRENPSGFSWNDWEEQGLSSPNFDSFKVYIIYCWNENEVFYKIGKTFKLVHNRFESNYELPYDYEVINIIESKTNARYICELELKLQKQHKDHRYIPKIEFAGMFECFSQIDESLLKNLEVTV